MEEETVETQPVAETATETMALEEVETQAVQPTTTPEYQINQQTQKVFKFPAVLKPVAAAVSQQITNKAHF